MQLILNTDPVIGIERKMAAIEQETLSLQEKFTKNIIEKLSVDNSCIVEENSLDKDVCKNNEDSKSNDSVDQSNDNQIETLNVERNSTECTYNVVNNESDQITSDINCEKLTTEEQNTDGECADNVVNNEIDQITLDVNLEKHTTEDFNCEKQTTVDINCEKQTTEEQKIDHNTELNQNTVEEPNADTQKNKDELAISNAQPISEKEDENGLLNSIETNKEEIEIVKPDLELSFFKESDVNEEDKIIEPEHPVENKEESENKTELDINIITLHEKTEQNDINVIKEDEISNIKENIVENLVDKEFSKILLLLSDSSNQKLENNDEVEKENISDDSICNKIELNLKENIDENMSSVKKNQFVEELCKEESTLKLRSNIEKEVIKTASTSSCNNIIETTETNRKTEVTEEMDQINKNNLEEEPAKSDEFIKTVQESTDVETEMNMEVIELSESDLSDTNVKLMDVDEPVSLDKQNDLDEMSEITKIHQVSDTEKNELSESDLSDTNIKLMDVDEPVSLDKQSDLDDINEVSKIHQISDTEKNMEITDTTVTNNEIINIADEKDEECVSILSKSKQGICDIEKEANSQDSKNKLGSVDSEKFENTDMKLSVENEEKKSSLSEEVISTEIHEKSDINLQDEKLNDSEKNIKADGQPKLIEKRTLSHISKLSNTLDILSDDDDDVVFLNDDEISHKGIEIENLVESEKKTEESIQNCNSKLKDDEALDTIANKTDNITEPQTKDSKTIKTELPEQDQKEKEEEKAIAKKPLLPTTFLKTCKKNLAEMSRDSLEEFCILKIVESVVDRSNLTEISSQLKKMASMIEDYKKKANTLLKQNRDLQVVLKSVQEEQKKCTNTPITPMKITRSVGMQVFLTEKPGGRKKPVAPNTFPSNQPNKVIKSQSNQVISNAKSPKVQTANNNNQNIPVPRLVPAVNTNSPMKVQAVVTPKPATPNGVKNSPPIQKAEKRPHSKIQNNSVTVDLTDDEPPAKIVQRNVTPPVRLVSQQSLLATQRPQFPNNLNNTPRKVFIPIGTAQNPVRPGQTIMLKSMGPQGPRMRPNLLPKPGPSNAIRARAAARHPAPLPDGMKQYQPPNWKELPPAPELKLSKVDNGIVISWKIQDYQEERHEEIASYQLYAYQETSSPPSTNLWKKIGDVKALPLPMACTLTQFMAGYKYYFAVRAVDIRSRLGLFSVPGSILLLNKM